MDVHVFVHARASVYLCDVRGYMHSCVRVNVCVCVL
jgi:hypothetical protein